MRDIVVLRQGGQISMGWAEGATCVEITIAYLRLR
jgi:hypothetical protein